MQHRFLTLLLFSSLFGAMVWAGELPTSPGEDADPRAAEQRFLAENAKKKGVISLPSGLQYEVIKKGEGRRPTLEDTVTVHYRGTFLDGREFESTYRAEMPETLRMDVAVPGWQEALQLMEEGAYWVIWMPPELAFGKYIAGAGRVLVYEINLLSVTVPEWEQTEPEEEGDPRGSDGASAISADHTEGDQTNRAPRSARSARDDDAQFSADEEGTTAGDETRAQARDEDQVAYAYWGRGPAAGKTLYPRGTGIGSPEDYAFLDANARKGGVIILPSGLQYKILRNGTGASPQPGDTVIVEYRGWLPGGQEFDSSYLAETPTTIRVDQAIAAWREALPRMEEGARWELYVLPELGCRTPERLDGRTQIFQIELLPIVPPDTSIRPRSEPLRSFHC